MRKADGTYSCQETATTENKSAPTAESNIHYHLEVNQNAPYTMILEGIQDHDIGAYQDPTLDGLPCKQCESLSGCLGNAGSAI